MANFHRFYSLLALLVMGSAGIQAQDDPFPEVDDSEFSNNMTLTGYVRLDGNILGQEAVVAVYDGDVLRGKARPITTKHNTDILFITIHGERNGQTLHFKVFTGLYVIEVDQGLIYTNDGRAGSVSDPYYIDLPTPIVTVPTAEGYATTCLPYDALIPENVNVYNATAIEGGMLVTEKLEGNILAALTPVLLESSSADEYVWLARVADADVTVTETIFVGTTEETHVEANSVLTLGHAEEDPTRLGFWLYTGTTVPANRAFIADFTDDNLTAGAKGIIFRPEDERTPTGVTQLPTIATHHPARPEETLASAGTTVYDLTGRRLTSVVTKGVYIINGRKTVVTK